MQETEEYQQHVSAEIDVGYLVAGAALLSTACHKNDACSEQHGKEPAHLALEEHPLEDQDEQVEVSMWTEKVVDGRADRDVVEGFGNSKVVDVHDQDTENPDAAKDVETR